MVCETCRRYVEENDELRAEIGNLKSELFNRTWEPHPSIGFTANESLIVAMMCGTDRTISKDMMVEGTRRSGRAKHGNTKEYPEMSEKLIDSYICKIRSKLKPYGAVVTTVYGRGYRITKEDRQKIMNIGEKVEEG